MIRQRFSEGKCHPARSTMQLYVESDFATQPMFPLRAGEAYRAELVGNAEALLVWRKGHPPNYPLTVDEPSPEKLPWPLPEHDPSLVEGHDTPTSAAQESPLPTAGEDARSSPTPGEQTDPFNYDHE